MTDPSGEPLHEETAVLPVGQTNEPMIVELWVHPSRGTKHEKGCIDADMAAYLGYELKRFREIV